MKAITFLFMTFTLTQAFAADQISCREAVVEANKSLGITVEPESFSNKTFPELNMSVDEFNALAPEEQDKLYAKLMPMSVKVEQTIKSLNRYIDEYSQGMYAIFYTDDLEKWRKSRDLLRNCEGK